MLLMGLTCVLAQTPANVYFTSEITPESLVRIYHALGVKPTGRVAIKISTGESSRTNYLRPEFIKGLVDETGGTIVECNTAYQGNRSNTESHRRAIAERGFTEVAPVDIMDEDGSLDIPVQDKTHMQFDRVGSHIANYDFLKAGSSDFSPMLTLRFDLKNIFPLGGRLALISDIHLRDIYTASETIDLEGGVHRDISILHSNFIGGSMSRRYTEGHIPFFGINNVLFVEDHVFSGSLELRYNPIGKLYVSALAGLMESNYTLDRLITEFNPDYYAFGMELGYDFITGPVRLNLHWNQVDRWGLYVSFGYDF